MGRIISQQRNTWGSAGNTDNPQRADLWVVDLQSVVRGLNAAIVANPTFDIAQLVELPLYFAQSIALPELKVTPAEFGRDSNPHQMPLNDEATGMVRIVFYMDSPGNQARSKVYQLLDTWRTFVRAGRPTFGSENGIPLYTTSDKVTYSTDHAFNISVQLLRGASKPEIIDVVNNISNEYYGNLDEFSRELASLPVEEREARMKQMLVNAGRTDEVGVINDLEVCGHYQIQQAWLSSFRVSDLSYVNGGALTTIEANIYADYFIDMAASAKKTASVYSTMSGVTS
jgi:hypothetical protein